MGEASGARGRVRRAVVRFAPFAGTITGVNTRAARVAALTFDDGPDPVYTPRFVEVLDRFGAKGTFFMVGSQAERHREVVARVVAHGHAVANHSFSHRSFVLEKHRAGTTGRWRRDEIRRGHDALEPWSERHFRPPYGHQDLGVRVDAMATRHDVVGWSVTAGDWLDDPPEAIAERVRSRIVPGAIVLFHDGLLTAFDDAYFDRDVSLRALELVLEALTPEYRFVTVADLLGYGPVVRRFVYPKPSWDEMPGRSR